MPNYTLKFTVADAARILEVDKNTVKTWTSKFAEYLSSKANPSKGTAREFQLEDIRVMAYISSKWEDDLDIECIKIGLDSNSHYDNPLIDNLISFLIPLFIEPPENIDESWKHGVIFAGLASLGDMLMLAKSYKLAGDRLVDIALKNEEVWELLYPAMFNYRHSIELYLKVIAGNDKQGHKLLTLYDRLKVILKTKYNSNPPEWFENVIISFNDFDPGSTTFRYGGGHERDEVFIDFKQLKILMGRLTQSFQNILQREGIH